MYSAGKRRGRCQKRVSPKPHRNGDIQRFLLSNPGTPPTAKMADATRTGPHDARQPQTTPARTPTPATQNLDNTVPAIFHTDSQESISHAPLTLRADAELRALLQALPTRADIEAILNRLEESHKQEIAAVRHDVQTLSERMDSGETSVATIEQRLAAVEAAQTAQASSILSQQLQMEEVEDRSRRNNLRLRGLPEATGMEDLAESTLAIFRDLLGEQYPPNLSFDRIHRALGPRSTDPERPRDVICRLHRYSHKELMLRAAWEKGEITFDGAVVRILPDLSKATLQRRALLKPLLEAARNAGITYRWGFPIAVTFKRNQHSFTLRSPADLPALFVFMGIDPIEVPDWLQSLQRTVYRPGPVSRWRSCSPRPQRNHRRSRYTSAEAPRKD